MDDDLARLATELAKELKRIRSHKGMIEDFVLADYPAILEVSQQPTLALALKWLHSHGDRLKEAPFKTRMAYFPIIANASDVNARLTSVVHGEHEARVVRRWGDEGMDSLARWLVDHSYLDNVCYHYITAAATTDGHFAVSIASYYPKPLAPGELDIRWEFPNLYEEPENVWFPELEVTGPTIRVDYGPNGPKASSLERRYDILTEYPSKVHPSTLALTFKGDHLLPYMSFTLATPIFPEYVIDFVAWRFRAGIKFWTLADG